MLHNIISKICVRTTKFSAMKLVDVLFSYFFYFDEAVNDTRNYPSCKLVNLLRSTFDCLVFICLRARFYYLMNTKLVSVD